MSDVRIDFSRCARARRKKKIENSFSTLSRAHQHNDSDIFTPRERVANAFSFGCLRVNPIRSKRRKRRRSYHEIAIKTQPFRDKNRQQLNSIDFSCSTLFTFSYLSLVALANLQNKQKKNIINAR